MKLWKRDTKLWTVREVEGEPWPGRDAEGDICYDNTHFKHEEEAWFSLNQEVCAYVSLSGRGVVQAEENLRAAHADAAKATKAFATVQDGLRARA